MGESVTERARNKTRGEGGIIREIAVLGDFFHHVGIFLSLRISKSHLPRSCFTSSISFSSPQLFRVGTPEAGWIPPLPSGATEDLE